MNKPNWFQKICGEDAYFDEGQTHDFVRRHNEGYQAYLDAKKPEVKNDDPMKVIIQPQKLDLSKLGGGSGEVKKFEFRPQTWEQFIGQKNAKARVPVIIEFFKRGMP